MKYWANSKKNSADLKAQPFEEEIFAEPIIQPFYWKKFQQDHRRSLLKKKCLWCRYAAFWLEEISAGPEMQPSDWKKFQQVQDSRYAAFWVEEISAGPDMQPSDWKTFRLVQILSLLQPSDWRRQLLKTSRVLIGWDPSQQTPFE